MPATSRSRTAEPLVSVPLTSTMAAAVPHLSPALAGAAARDALGDITDRIPAALTRRAYLECRLAGGAPAVDVVFCVDSSSRALLTSPLRAWLPEHLRAHPLWKGLERLCSEWADPGSRIGRRVYDLWLEFDAPQCPGHRHALVPSVFVGLSRSVTTRPLELWDAAIAHVEIITGRSVHPSIAAAARGAVERLPPGATLPYVGLMYPRNEKAIRLCVAPLAGAELLDYLGSIGWRGEAADLGALLRSIPHGRATAFESTTLLHVDVLDGVQPRIGLEIPLRQYPQLVDGIREVELLDALCHQGLCTPEKRDALVQWPGHTTEQFRHHCWPSLALRRVSHVKLVCEPGRRPEAKTYLSFFHHYSRRGARARDLPAAPRVSSTFVSGAAGSPRAR